MNLPVRPTRIPIGRRRTVVLWPEDAVRGLARRVGPGRADVIVTSPPYNIGVRYRSYRDDRPRTDYLAWTGRVGAAVAAVLAPGGSFFLNVAGTPKDPWLPWDVAREVGRHLVLQNVIHWVKSIAIDRRAAGKAAGLDRDLALGHYKPVVSDRFLHGGHEYVFHFTHTGDVRLDRLAVGVPYSDKSNVHRWGGAAGDRRCRGNTWFLPYPTIRERARDRPHPATFPPELAETCVRLHGLGATHRVVDPFVGIGSSAVAAVRLGVDFVGFDVDPEYLRVAAERVRQEVRRVAARGGDASSRAGSAGSPSRAAGTTPSSASA